MGEPIPGTGRLRAIDGHADAPRASAHRSASGGKRMARPVGKWFLQLAQTVRTNVSGHSAIAVGQDGDPRVSTPHGPMTRCPSRLEVRSTAAMVFASAPRPTRTLTPSILTSIIPKVRSPIQRSSQSPINHLTKRWDHHSAYKSSRSNNPVSSLRRIPSLHHSISCSGLIIGLFHYAHGLVASET